MSARRAGAAALGAMLLCAGGFLGWRYLHAPAPDSVDQRAARALGAGIVAGMSAAEELLEPYRCARPDQALESHPQTFFVGAGTDRREAVMIDHTLRLAVADGRPIRVAVVADARGSVAHLEGLRAALRAQPASHAVDLVISLGGMARESEGIRAALDALTGPWFVIALPGDWEDYGAHRQAVASLAEQGVIDGARARIVRLADAATLLTVPGVPQRARALPGVDACVFTDQDVAASAALLGAASSEPGADNAPRVLVAHAPPRQRGPDASDASAAGVHMGEIALARALSDAGMALALHGLVTPAKTPSTRRAVALESAHPLILGAGPGDGIGDISRGGTWPARALVITLGSGSVTWTYLEE